MSYSGTGFSLLLPWTVLPISLPRPLLQLPLPRALLSASGLGRWATGVLSLLVNGGYVRCGGAPSALFEIALVFDAGFGHLPRSRHADWRGQEIAGTANWRRLFSLSKPRSLHLRVGNGRCPRAARVGGNRAALVAAFASHGGWRSNKWNSRLNEHCSRASFAYGVSRSGFQSYHNAVRPGDD